jgi:hypothetical protein
MNKIESFILTGGGQAVGMFSLSKESLLDKKLMKIVQ